MVVVMMRSQIQCTALSTTKKKTARYAMRKKEDKTV